MDAPTPKKHGSQLWFVKRSHHFKRLMEMVMQQGDKRIRNLYETLLGFVSPVGMFDAADAMFDEMFPILYLDIFSNMW